MSILYKKRFWMISLVSVLLIIVVILLYPRIRYYTYKYTHRGREYPENYTGSWQVYYDLYLIKSFTLKNGRLDGAYKRYHATTYMDPRLIEVIHFNNGVKHGIYRLYSYPYPTKPSNGNECNYTMKLSREMIFDNGVCRELSSYEYLLLPDEKKKLCDYIICSKYLFNDKGNLVNNYGKPRKRADTPITDIKIPWFKAIPDWFRLCPYPYRMGDQEIKPEWFSPLEDKSKKTIFNECYHSQKLNLYGVSQYILFPFWPEFHSDHKGFCFNNNGYAIYGSDFTWPEPNSKTQTKMQP